MPFVFCQVSIIDTRSAINDPTISLTAPDPKSANEMMNNSPRPITDTSSVNLYFISGLGADKRVFSKLKLDKRFTVHNVEWIRPLKKETIKHYAQRLVVQIDTTKPFKLIGLSFGGIIASELSEIIHPDQIVIISSTSTGIPVSRFYQGLLKFLLLSPFASPLLKSANKISYKYFGADTPELKALLKSILRDSDPKLLKWALLQISKWSRKEKAKNLYHIHGTADKLIPLKLVHPDTMVDGGGHLMVYSHHEKISNLLNALLQKN